MIRAIVFDLDGVLVDAAPWHYEALSKALGVFGFHIHPEDHDAKYNGLPTKEKLRLLSAQTSFPKKLHGLVGDLKQAYTEELFREKCQPSLVIKELMEQLKQQGYLIGLASNSRRSTIDFVVERMQLSSYLDVVLSHEEVSRPKPSADIYLAAFAKLGVAAHETLVIEDAPAGIQAARSSGAVVLQVFSPDQVNCRNVQTFLKSIENRSGEMNSDKESTRRCLQILIPMAGEGTRFREAGFEAPKPFIDVQGKPMIEWVVDNVRPSDRDYRFVFLTQKKHLNATGRNEILDKTASGSVIIPVPGLTQGAACTTLLAADSLDENAPLLLANSDQWVDMDITQFLKFCDDEDCDGAMLTFTASEKKWSYALTDEQGSVQRVAEKDPISTHATVGIYYFKRAGDFLDAASRMIAKNNRTNGEFYVCPVYNQLINAGKKIRIYPIDSTQMHGLGTPEDLKNFLAKSA